MAEVICGSQLFRYSLLIIGKNELTTMVEFIGLIYMTAPNVWSITFWNHNVSNPWWIRVCFHIWVHTVYVFWLCRQLFSTQWKAHSDLITASQRGSPCHWCFCHSFSLCLFLSVAGGASGFGSSIERRYAFLHICLSYVEWRLLNYYNLWSDFQLLLKIPLKYQLWFKKKLLPWMMTN